MSVGCVLLLQLKKDKVELENQLEQEQEALVNRLWKRMDKLEAEKRLVLDHTHPFNGPLSGTTQVSRYQKGKSNLDFIAARDSE